MLKHIDHVGFIVEDIEQAISTYVELGYAVRNRVEIDGGATKIAFLDPPVPGAAIELMQPTPGVGRLGLFLRDRGAGMHHVAFWVDDVDAALQQLKAKGFQGGDEQSRVGVGGRIAYAGEYQGVLIQLVNR